jgi:hypothetical protein
MSQIPEDMPPGFTNLTDLAQCYVKLLEQNKLPGFSPGQHGRANLYRLPLEIRKEWLQKRYINESMLSDIEGHADVYFVAVETQKPKKNLRYLFFKENGEFRLVSAYQYAKDGWLKLDLKKESEGAAMKGN